MLQKSREGKIVRNLPHFAGKNVAINPAADHLADMLEHIFQCDHGTPVKTRQTPARRNWLRPWTSCNMPEDFQNLTKLKTNKVWERNFQAMFSFVLWCYILIFIDFFFCDGQVAWDSQNYNRFSLGCGFEFVLQRIHLPHPWSRWPCIGTNPAKGAALTWETQEDEGLNVKLLQNLLGTLLKKPPTRVYVQLLFISFCTYTFTFKLKGLTFPSTQNHMAYTITFIALKITISPACNTTCILIPNQ